MFHKFLRFGVSGLLLLWMGLKLDWIEVQKAFATLRVEYWIGAVALLTLTQLVSALRWQIFAKELRFSHSFKQLSSFYFIGMYFNLLLPTSVGGDVVRAIYLNRGQGRRLAALATVFLDRLNGVFVLVALAILAVLFSTTPLDNRVTLSVWAVTAVGTLGVLGLMVIARWGKLPSNRQQQMQTMLDLMKAPHLLLAATGLSLLVQLGNIVIVWLVSIGLELPVPFGYYGILVPMVSLLTLIPITINGTGLREWGTALFLLPFGVDENQAVSLALLWFAVHLAVSALGGLVYLFGNFPKPVSSEDFDHGSVDRDSDQGRTRQYQQAA